MVDRTPVKTDKFCGHKMPISGVTGYYGQAYYNHDLTLPTALIIFCRHRRKLSKLDLELEIQCRSIHKQNSNARK